MAGELFKSMAGLDITHVPYKGSSGARTDVIGGQVDMMFDAVTTMTEFVKEHTGMSCLPIDVMHASGLFFC
jgi:tripartite-type tricarboxylate transporter receptor subunit TctC